MIEDSFVNMKDRCVTTDQDINNDDIKITQNLYNLHLAQKETQSHCC